MKKRQRTRFRVLALHGEGATPALWDDVADAVPEVDLLAPDLVAITHAVGGRLGPLVRTLAGMVSREAVIVAGCGVGANVALEVGALLAPRTAGVVLISPQPFRPEPSYRERIRQLCRLMRMQMDDGELAAWVPLMVHRGGLRWNTAGPQAEAMLQEVGGPGCASLYQIAADFPEGSLALKMIRAPVRAFFGRDTVNPFPGPSWVPEWQKALGPTNVELVPSTRHWLPLEAPERIAGALREFVNRGSSATDAR